MTHTTPLLGSANTDVTSLIPHFPYSTSVEYEEGRGEKCVTFPVPFFVTLRVEIDNKKGCSSLLDFFGDTQTQGPGSGVDKLQEISYETDVTNVNMRTIKTITVIHNH